MPTYTAGLTANHEPIVRRRTFEPGPYTVPSGFIQDLEQHYKNVGFESLNHHPDNPFSLLSHVRTIQRDGRAFALMRRNSSTEEWAFEIEVLPARLGEIRCLTPEEAFALARERDALYRTMVELDE